eukprot:2553348-Ditylum_brightwellii.AAC.1
MGTILDPNKKDNFSVYVDADFQKIGSRRQLCMRPVLPNQGQITSLLMMVVPFYGHPSYKPWSLYLPLKLSMLHSVWQLERP